MTLNFRNINSFLINYNTDFDSKKRHKELIKDFEELTQKMSNSDYKYLCESNLNGRYDKCLDVIEHKIKKEQDEQWKYYQMYQEVTKRAIFYNTTRLAAIKLKILEYNDKIEKLKLKKIGKWNNIFLRVITFGFVNWNQTIINLQNKLEADKFITEESIKSNEQEKQELKRWEWIDADFNQKLQNLDTSLNDLEKLRIEYEKKTAKYSSKVVEKFQEKIIYGKKEIINNINEINSTDLQNQASTSGYKPSSPQIYL